MKNRFIDKRFTSATLSRVRISDPFCVHVEGSVLEYGYRVVWVETAFQESIIFCFDRIQRIAPSVTWALSAIHESFVRHPEYPFNAQWYEFIPVNWLRMGPAFWPIGIDNQHLVDRAAWTPLSWLSDEHVIAPQELAVLAGPVFELVTTADVSLLAEQHQGETREQILMLSGLAAGKKPKGDKRRDDVPPYRAPERKGSRSNRIGTFNLRAYLHQLSRR